MTPEDFKQLLPIITVAANGLLKTGDDTLAEFSKTGEPEEREFLAQIIDHVGGSVNKFFTKAAEIVRTAK